MTIGERIQEIATRKNKSLMQVAKDAGIPYNTLYSIVKRGSDNISFDKVKAIAKALGVSDFELLTGEDDRDFDKEIEFYLQMQKNKSIEKWMAEFAINNPLLMQALKNEGINIFVDSTFSSLVAQYEHSNGKRTLETTSFIEEEDLERLLKKTKSDFHRNIENYLNLSIDEKSEEDDADEGSEGDGE